MTQTKCFKIIHIHSRKNEKKIMVCNNPKKYFIKHKSLTSEEWYHTLTQRMSLFCGHTDYWERAFVTLISFLPGTCQGKSSAKKVQSIHTLFEKKGALCLG